MSKKKVKENIDLIENMVVTINPLTYNIIFEDSPKIDEEFILGYIDQEQLEIKIKSTMHKDRRRVVVIHEILHGMLMKSGLNLKEEEDEHYEQIIEVLSHSILALIRQNPKLFEYLQGTD